MLKLVHYRLQMCLKILEISVLKYMELILHILSTLGLAWQTCLKKTGIKLEVIINYDVLLITEKGIRGVICQTTHRYAKANNKYMKNCGKNNQSSYTEYLDANNLYG